MMRRRCAALGISLAALFAAAGGAAAAAQALEVSDPEPAADAAAIEELAAPAAAEAEPAAEPEAQAPETGKKKKKSRKEKKEAKSEGLDEAPKAAAAAGAATPPMWRLADADTEIWLLGTFHVLPPGTDWRSGPLGAALDQADRIWFEAEVDTPEAKAATLRILKTEGVNPPGRRLSEMLAPEEAEKLAGIAGSLGLPMQAIDQMRPWHAFLMLSVQMIVGKGFDPASGLETMLLAEARARGRDLQFFESAEQQLGFFSALKPAVEKELLAVTLREWETQGAELGALFDAWRAGDADAIDALMNERLRAAAPEVYEALLRKRNVAWTKAIAAAMGSPGKTVVAVGAGHLVGEHSVPAMLAAEGFEVARYGVDAPAAANDNAAPAEADAPPAKGPADDIGALIETLEPEAPANDE